MSETVYTRDAITTGQLLIKQGTHYFTAARPNPKVALNPKTNPNHCGQRAA